MDIPYVVSVAIFLLLGAMEGNEWREVAACCAVVVCFTCVVEHCGGVGVDYPCEFALPRMTFFYKKKDQKPMQARLAAGLNACWRIQTQVATENTSR